MTRKRIVFLLLALLLATEAAKKKRRQRNRVDYSRQALVSTVPRNKADIDYLRNLEKDNIVDLWHASLQKDEKVLMRIDRNRFRNVKKELQKRRMRSSVVIPNLQRSVLKERKENDIRSRYRDSDPKNFDFNRYHSIDEIVDFLYFITNNNRNISRMVVIARTSENRPLNAVEISSEPYWPILEKKINRAQNFTRGASKKKLVVMDCGIHAREWASIAFCLYAISELIEGDARMKKVLGKFDFIIIPAMNPDGYQYSYTTERMWRKTRSRDKEFPNCVGVDPNRNFNVSFGLCDDILPCSPLYCGKKPFSEPETAGLDNLLKKTSKRLMAYFSFHTFGQLWLLPWAKTDQFAPHNFKKMEKIGKIGAKALESKYGTKYKVGMASKLVYIGRGTSLDYVYEKGYTDYSFTLELRDTGQHGFLLPVGQLAPLCVETMAGVVAALLALK